MKAASCSNSLGCRSAREVRKRVRTAKKAGVSNGAPVARRAACERLIVCIVCEVKKRKADGYKSLDCQAEATSGARQEVRGRAAATEEREEFRRPGESAARLE